MPEQIEQGESLVVALQVPQRARVLDEELAEIGLGQPKIEGPLVVRSGIRFTTDRIAGGTGLVCGARIRLRAFGDECIDSVQKLVVAEVGNYCPDRVDAIIPVCGAYRSTVAGCASTSSATEAYGP